MEGQISGCGPSGTLSRATPPHNYIIIKKRKSQDNILLDFFPKGHATNEKSYNS